MEAGVAELLGGEAIVLAESGREVTLGGEAEQGGDIADRVGSIREEAGGLVHTKVVDIVEDRHGEDLLEDLLESALVGADGGGELTERRRVLEILVEDIASLEDLAADSVAIGQRLMELLVVVVDETLDD